MVDVRVNGRTPSGEAPKNTSNVGLAVRELITFVDKNSIPITVGGTKFTDETPGQTTPAAQNQTATAAFRGARQLDVSSFRANLDNLDKALDTSRPSKYNLTALKAELIKKGIPAETLAKYSGLTGDALISALIQDLGLKEDDFLTDAGKIAKQIDEEIKKPNPDNAKLAQLADQLKAAAGYNPTIYSSTITTITLAPVIAARTSVPTPKTPDNPNPTITPAPVTARQPAQPQGLNDNGRAIWLFVFNQTGKKLDITATQKIAQDGVIDQKEAGEVGINMVVFDGVDNGMLDNTTRAAGATVGDRKLDATELAHYNTVVKELAQRTGKSEKEIYTAYQTAKYLVNVDLREVGSRIDNLSGLIRGGKIDFAKIKAGDTAEIERLKTLIGKDVHVDIVGDLITQIRAGHITNAEGVNKYFFNAMMGSLTGEFKFWGVADFGNLPNIGRYTPRAGKSGDDLSTWLRTGKSPEAEGASGTAGSGDEESIRKANIARERIKEASNGDEAKTRYEQAVRENKLQANDKEALIEIARKYSSKQEWDKLVPFASQLDPAVRSEFYRQALETIQQDFNGQISGNKLAEAESTTKQLEELIVKMGEDGNKYKPEANKMRLQLSLKYADANNKDKAYTIINAIPVGGEITWKDGDQSRSLSRNEARFMVAEKFHDSTPMNEVIADATSPATDKALANIYLAKIKETPNNKTQLEAVLKDYTKAAEAIKADSSPKANTLRERIRGEMRNALDTYERDHRSEGYQVTQFRDKYLNKMPLPASTPATTTPTTGRTGGPGTPVKPGTTDRAKAAADGATG